MNKSKEYYLSLGMEEKYADYFSTGRKNLCDVQPQEDFSLLLVYETGETRSFSMKELIYDDSSFSFLQDKTRFSQVYLDDCRSVCWDRDPTVDSELEWNNKVDLCPDVLYVESVDIAHFCSP